MITPSWKPMIFIVSAPSGAGKTTLCDRLQAEFKSLHYAVTATTRAPREGEVDGKSYYFLTREDFERRLSEGRFLESALVHGHRYGSPRDPVEQALKDGKDVLMNLDVQGAASVRDYVARLPMGDRLKREVVDIFVVPPSLEVLQNRLLKRGKDSQEVIERRLKQAEEEISHWREYRYMVVNDDLAEAYDNMRAIILAERHRISNRAEDRYE
ncbi:MAG TPA: guanylate kinase [Verrucomicrobia bacterium]|nr:MAG: guanylate kinase [Lentisphaerae bacterium GWF2_57_35]HBA86251.1 guanylate kinase [Verrucomicrobiota bacterium]